MARSSYVYVVVSPALGPIAGFTVKHELVAYLKKDPLNVFKAVYRLPDNVFPGRQPVQLDVHELVA